MSNEKMTNSLVNSKLKELGKMTKRKYYISSMMIDDTTTYGIMRVNKDKTREIIIPFDYNKRELFYMIKGFLLFRKEEEGNR